MDRRAFLKAGSAAGLVLSSPYIARGAFPMTLRWAHFAKEDHPAHIAAMQFAAAVEERTDGEIRIKIFPNNVLGGPIEQIQQIKFGMIDMGLPTQGQLDKYDGAFAVIPLPFAFDGPEHVYRVLDGPAMEWLAPLAEKRGFVLLHNWDYGFRNLTNSVRPINTPDDVKGLKLRTPPELQILASMEALGAVVQTMELPAVFVALSQHVFDGQENPIAVIYFNKFYQVQKHLALTRHVYNNMVHTIGTYTWRRLSPEQQAIFREESAAAANLMRRLIGEQEAELIGKLEAAGLQVTRPDLAPFRARMEPAYKRIAAYAGEANVKKFQEMVEQGRQA
jgi:tripartite ATP-independent transporter DctP family solute receptor